MSLSTPRRPYIQGKARGRLPDVIGDVEANSGTNSASARVP